MTVSVIIPVYNRIDTLKSAIESVLCQTYREIEIIVVDDGSDLDIKTALKPYLSKIQYIRNESNLGVSSARNLGIKVSTGEYVALLDSDDLFLPFKLELQLSSMIDKNLSISHTDEFWYKADRFINKQKKHEAYGGHVLEKILDFCRISPSSLLFKKDILNTTGLFDESMRVCEDYDLFLRFALFFEIDYINTKAIIKRAVTDDQLSASINHIESVRLKSLSGFYKNYASHMNFSQTEAVKNELKRKYKIVENGVIK